MFDPLLELKRRRMMGVPQVTGNVLPPDVGPDIQAENPVVPTPLVMQPLPAQGGADLSALSQLGARRGMDALMRKLKPEKKDALASLPVLKNLFRR